MRDKKLDYANEPSVMMAVWVVDDENKICMNTHPLYSIWNDTKYVSTAGIPACEMALG